MNERQRPREITKNKSKTMEWLMPLLISFPQVLKNEIGTEEFVEELNKACIKMVEYSDDDLIAMKELLEIIKDFPHIIQPGIGIEEFIMKTVSAGIKYKVYFPETKQED